MSGYVFQQTDLPEPVTVQDLGDRLHLLTGYMLGVLSRTEGIEQDLYAAKALRWCVPRVRALLVLADRHVEEFRELVRLELDGG